MPCYAMAPSGTPTCSRPLDTQYGCSPVAMGRGPSGWRLGVRANACDITAFTRSSYQKVAKMARVVPKASETRRAAGDAPMGAGADADPGVPAVAAGTL